MSTTQAQTDETQKALDTSEEKRAAKTWGAVDELESTMLRESYGWSHGAQLALVNGYVSMVTRYAKAHGDIIFAEPKALLGFAGAGIALIMGAFLAIQEGTIELSRGYIVAALALAFIVIYFGDLLKQQVTKS